MPRETSAIAVTGMACWYPGASNPKQLWENILTRRRQFRRTPDVRLPITDYHDPNPAAPDKTYGKQMAVLDGFEFDWSGKRIPKPTYESTDIVHWLALDTAIKAFLDAGYTQEDIPAEQTGVIVGNTLTGEVSRSVSLRLRWPYIAKALRAAGQSLGMDAAAIIALEGMMEAYHKQPLPPINQDTLAGFLSNTIAGRICNYLNLQGGGYTVDGACSSSLISIATAAQGLVTGDLNLALAGGVDISLDPFEMVGFAKTKALSAKEMSVYDLQASGFIPGEGCGFVVLKRLEDARKDGDYVYAVLRGWGISSDGAGVGITAPSGSGQARALKRAYEKAGYSARELDFVEGHGTGTPVGDRAELKGITLAMGEPDKAPDQSSAQESEKQQSTKPRSCGVTSLKSIVGHTKAAAGIGGFIKAAMAVNRRVLPPTAGCKEPNEVFETTATRLYPILQGECRSAEDTLRAGVSAMGFGGSNCHVTLESGDSPSSRLAPDLLESELLVSYQESELFVFSAESVEALQKQIEAQKAIAPHLSVGDLTDFAAHLIQSFDSAHSLRAAVIASTPNELVDHLHWLEQTLADAPPKKGEVKANVLQTVWLSEAKSEAKSDYEIGFLFPGQGSQRLNMARSLVERFSWAKEMVEQADQWLQEIGISPVSPLIYRALDSAANEAQQKAWKRTLAQTEVAQPAICLASLIWLRYLNKLGIHPAAVGGHSLGELTAFCAAGAFDEKALLQLAALRGQAMAASTEDAGTMASLGCDKQQTEDLLNRVKDQGGLQDMADVVIANINSPTQTIISGSKAGVEAIVELALEDDIQTRLLPVSNAFHSPFVASAAQTLRQSVPVPPHLGALTCQLFSSIDGEQIQSGLNLASHFSQQITAQVDFIKLVNSVSEKCDLLIEVGPGKVLSGLTRGINGIEGVACFPVEAKSEQDRDINTAVATLFTHGVTVNWDMFYENRLVRPWVWPRQFMVNPCETPLTAIDPPENIVGLGMPSQLTELTDLSAQAFSRYLTTRGAFVADVIKADLQHWPSTSDSVLETTSSATASDTSASANEQAEIIDGTEEGGPEQSVEESLIEKIVQETGYSKESIPLTARLLDDLRLESIKAGEIIGSTAAKYGVAGKVEPPELANSTLTEIAEAIRGAMAQGEGTAAKASKEKTWVRNFAVEYVPEALPDRTEMSASADATTDTAKNIDWTKANCLIACDAEEREIADRLSQLLKDLGSEVQSRSFVAAGDAALTNLADYSHLIAILPRQASADALSPTGIAAILERLHVFTTPPTENSRRHSSLTVSYVQFGGGTFGTRFPGVSIEQTCTQALAASLHLERPDLKVRALDFAPYVAPGMLAERVIAELSTSDTYAAVGYDSRLQRRVPRPVVQEPADYTQREIAWSEEDVMLVTGGAKGITAECALALAESTGVKMALVGSSPHPDEAADNPRSQAITTTLNRFAEKSLSCRYYSCDVADASAVQALVDQVQQDMGCITGVVHGAAINRPRSLDTVSPTEALAEVAPKLNGVINFCAALEAAPPKLFVGLSSIIGFTGMQRNGWYGFSNEAMELILQEFAARHAQTEVLCTAYSVWDEVGMGFEMGAVRHLRQMGIGAIAKDEGVRRFVNLVQHNPGENRILITGPMRTIGAASSGFDTWAPQLLNWPRTEKFINLPGINEPGVEVVRRSHLNLQDHAYLKDHLYKGSYLFPTVFGLEAMSQAVALVTGNDEFPAVRIEDIRLERGIVVDPKKGTHIEVRAQVLERQSPTEPRRVQASIRTELSGFSKDHFSATFVLDVDAKAPIEKVDLPESWPETSLDIRPEEDLYGPLLFQGPLFQRLRSFYSIAGDRCIFSAEQITTAPSDEPKLMGDPFFRDSLLQSGQATIPQDLCLPIGIERWEIYQPQRLGSRSLIGIVTMNARDEQEYNTSISVVDEDGILVERLTGYRLRILDHQPDNPTAQQLADPDLRDESILKNKLATIAERFDIVVPEVAVMNVAGLHQLETSDRHQQELPLLQKVIGQLLSQDSESPSLSKTILTETLASPALQIKWLESGNPVVQGRAENNIDISLSHDERLCLCVAGYGLQGCDLEPIVPRSESDWTTLLGELQQPLLQQLMGVDPAPVAGARLWTAQEALVKAQQSDQKLNLQIESRQGEYVLFSVGSSGQKVITFPVKFTRGKERLVALMISSEVDTVNPPSEAEIVASAG